LWNLGDDPRLTTKW